MDQVVKWEFPFLIFATLIVSAITLFNPELTLAWGFAFLFLFCIAMFNWYKQGKSGTSILVVQSEELAEGESHSAIAGCFLLLIGLTLLGIGGKLAEIGAVAVATKMGISQLVIGVTIVAIATSLPEVVTTVIAARKGHPDLAVGNVVGSNLFNMLFVLPTSLFVGTITVPSDIWIYLSAMCAITLIAYICAFNKRVKPVEGGILLSLYAAFLIALVIWKSS